MPASADPLQNRQGRRLRTLGVPTVVDPSGRFGYGPRVLRVAAMMRIRGARIADGLRHHHVDARQTSPLAGIDYAIMGLYLVGIVLIGTYFGRYVKTGKDFFLAGRALPFWAIGMSILAALITLSQSKDARPLATATCH